MAARCYRRCCTSGFPGPPGWAMRAFEVHGRVRVPGRSEERGAVTAADVVPRCLSKAQATYHPSRSAPDAPVKNGAVVAINNCRASLGALEKILEVSGVYIS